MKSVTFLILLLMPLTVMADDWFTPPDLFNQDWQDGWSVEARGAWVDFRSHRMRRIYRQARVEGQIEIGKTLGCSPWEAFFNVSYFRKRGRSIGFDDNTRISIFPFSFGLKRYFDFFSFGRFYVGGGATYGFLKITDSSPFAIGNTRKHAWGGVIKTGLQYDLGCQLYLDLFADYVFQKYRFHGFSRGVYRRDVDVSGFRTGLGLGYRF